MVVWPTTQGLKNTNDRRQVVPKYLGGPTHDYH